MTFKQDVASTAGLEQAWRPGKRALRAADSDKVTASPPGRLAGSVDVDTALRHRFPNANRWDYVVGWNAARRGQILHWIEVHPADRMGTLNEVLAKLTWLKSWLLGEGTRLNARERKFVWIASGTVAFGGNAPQLKRLALAGVYFAGRHYTISD